MNVIKISGVLFIIVLSFYFRIGAITNTEVDNPIRADAADYYNYAHNLKHFGVYSRSRIGEKIIIPDALRSPGYPLYLTALIEWPPTEKMLLKINFSHVILGLLTVIFSFLLFKRLISYWYALIAAFLTSISPHLISFTTYLLTETLFTFLLVFTSWVLVISYEKKNISLMILSGALLGFCALTRPTLNYFIILICMFLFFQFGKRDGIKYSLSLLVGFVLIFSPWSIRNMSLTNSNKSLVINTIHHGMYPDFMYQDKAESKGFPYHYDPDSAVISKNMNALLKELKRRFFNETSKHLNWYILGKPVTLFSWSVLNGWGDVFIYPVIKTPYLDNFSFKASRLIMYWIHWPLISMSIVACVIVWIPTFIVSIDSSKLFVARFTSLLILYFLILHIVAAPFPRYSVPLRPFNYGMAIFFMTFLISYLKNLKLLKKNR